MRHGLPLVIALGVVSIASVDCSSRSDCTPSNQPVGVVLHAATTAVTSLTGGGACAGAQVRCVPNDFSAAFTPGCAQYQVLPRQAGACTIEVRTADGAKTTIAVTIVDRTKNECEGPNGYYTSLPGDSEQYIAPSDAGVPDAASGG